MNTNEWRFCHWRMTMLKIHASQPIAVSRLISSRKPRRYVGENLARMYTYRKGLPSSGLTSRQQLPRRIDSLDRAFQLYIHCYLMLIWTLGIFALRARYPNAPSRDARRTLSRPHPIVKYAPASTVRPISRSTCTVESCTEFASPRFSCGDAKNPRFLSIVRLLIVSFYLCVISFTGLSQGENEACKTKLCSERCDRNIWRRYIFGGCQMCKIMHFVSCFY